MDNTPLVSHLVFQNDVNPRSPRIHAVLRQFTKKVHGSRKLVDEVLHRLCRDRVHGEVGLLCHCVTLRLRVHHSSKVLLKEALFATE